jgi:HEAT repeat protein
MSRIALSSLFATFLPVVAAGQTPPTPPAPPTPAAPQSVPAPAPAPRAVRVLAPPDGMVWAPPAIIDSESVQAAIAAGRAIAAQSDEIRAVARQAADDARQAAEASRDGWRLAPVVMPDIRLNLDSARWVDLQEMQVFSQSSSTDGNYSSGLSALTQGNYDMAVTRFDRVIAAKGTHVDGALYYKAWALSRLGRSDDAVAALNELKKSYGSSPYMTEARALEANVKKLGPGQVNDDDLKLLAIQAIQYSDPEKAVSTCEAVLSGTNSLAVKKRAIYVLALIDRPEAHQLLLSYAKGKGNPELQREAITYLGARNAKQPTKSAELIDIYNSTTDADVRMSVISAFRSAGDKTSLIGIASGRGVGRGDGVGPVGAPQGRGGQMAPMPMTMNERSRAINNLSDLASPQELWPLYQKEENKDLRSAWVTTFSSMGALDQLTQIVKTEKEPAVRQKAIRALGNQKSEKTGPMLADLYSGGDRDTKLAVISALGNQNNADSLIALARKESDKDLKYQMARELLNMAPRNKAAADYLAEIIK